MSQNLIRTICRIDVAVSIVLLCSCLPSYGQAIANGADVGWLTQLESFGYKYIDETQTQQDALQILKNHGINAIRIRTFVNPTISSTSLGVGQTNQAGSIALAQRANAMGFRIMIDFHYSDTWADPGHQAIPAAWAHDSFSQLETDLYNYTHNFMSALASAGIHPEWVQVGNEIDPGMLLPLGSTSNFTQLTGLINSGYNAVKAVSPATKVIVHLSTISNLSHFESFFDNLVSHGGSFDVIGGSYYDGPGTITTVASNLNTLAARYSRPVIIAEIGHTYSDWDGSSADVKSARQAIAAVPNNRGLGVFYWEPEGPDDSTTSNYSLGAVVENTSHILQFTTAMDQYLFTVGSANQVIDPTFTTGLNGWQITSNGNYNAVSVQTSGSTKYLSFFKSTAYQATVWQTATALASGTYTLTAQVMNGGGQVSATMFAWPSGGSQISVNLPVAASTWTQVKISNIHVPASGQVYLGFSINANPGNWTDISSVQLTKN